MTSASVLRDLALSGADGLTAAQNARHDGALSIADRGDLHLAADYLSRIEIPGVWSVSDDPARSARIVATARQCIADTDLDIAPVQRARLWALAGIESRGTRGPRGADAARRALDLARELRDPTALAMALNADFLQSFHGDRGIDQRRAIGDELIDLAQTYDLPTYCILGHLICLQSCCGAVDFDAADHHAREADRLGTHHERTLVGFFTTWYRATRAELSGASTREIDDAYASATNLLPTCGMPGVANGLESLVILVRRLRCGAPLDDLRELDFGPNAPWATPLILHARGELDDAVGALRRAPAPPPDHLAGTRWALATIAARRLGDTSMISAGVTELARLPPYPIGADTALFALPRPDELRDLGGV